MVEQQSTNFVHPCVILLLVIVELVVEVVPCTLLGESQVGDKVVDAFTHSLLLLMQSTLCTEEVTLGDEGVHVIVLLHDEWVGRSTWPIHHSKQICTLTDVEDGSMITQMWNMEIAQFIPILVGVSHLHK